MPEKKKSTKKLIFIALNCAFFTFEQKEVSQNVHISQDTEQWFTQWKFSCSFDFFVTRRTKEKTAGFIPTFEVLFNFQTLDSTVITKYGFAVELFVGSDLEIISLA